MSTFLYVVYPSPVTSAMLDSELHRFVLDRCSGRVLNNALQGFHFNVTSEAEGIFVEPFVQGASLIAILGQKKKQKMTVAFLRAMFEWGESRGSNGHLIKISSRPRRPDKVMRFGSIGEFVQAFRIDPPP